MMLKKGKYGNFLECTKCGAKRPYLAAGDSGEQVKTEGKCPDCGKPMRRMRSKTGKIYYGCTGYPDCKFLSWDIPTGDKCPRCGKFLIKRGNKIKCSEKDCGYSVDVPEEDEQN